LAVVRRRSSDQTIVFDSSARYRSMPVAISKVKSRIARLLFFQMRLRFLRQQVLGSFLKPAHYANSFGIIANIRQNAMSSSNLHCKVPNQSCFFFYRALVYLSEHLLSGIDRYLPQVPVRLGGFR
jgi:hypothetical protein